ncbi:amiloride-sensitive sodium channel subunit beta-like isoform X2 [Mercenaria mercenaria]|nr:amiloride-sensitive sodium channel subunit beta-like isoform X2 [Mercenaria mercenaria]XP_045160275.1 amiloride-sensitive sodium channel subunit beta-like isoform X2 [Mercenaria mercenaria]XP_045160276.1 amiloride-sensitive sodium channel subunit beta-like isoform X2 [Mercenaria mercenaria]
MADRKSRDIAKDSASNASIDSMGKEKSFRRLLTRFADKTSMVGVCYISNAKFWWAKLIWSFMLLVAIGVMSLHLWYVVDQYTDWPVQTKLSLGYETLRFPEVIICNTNVMHKGRFDRYDGAYELKKLIRDLQPENLVPDQFDANYDPYATKPPTVTTPTPLQNRRKRFVDQYENFNKSQYDKKGVPNPRDVKEKDDDDFDGKVDAQTEIDDLFTELYMDIEKDQRSRLGHNITDMLVSCTFNGRECTADMFHLHQTSDYGNCWSLRSEKFNVKTSGPSGGLSLVLFLEVTEYLKGITTGYGARIQIHEQRTHPSPAEEGLFIPASMETDIGLRMLTIERLGGLYGNCDNGDAFMKDYSLKYSRRACQQFCKISEIMEICKCFDQKSEEFARMKDNKLRPCRSQPEIECMVKIVKQFEAQSLSCTCENPCSEIHYTKSVSQRQWPADDYAMVLLQGVCEKDKAVCLSLRGDISDISKISNNFLKLNIYYEDLNYENITEVPEIELQQFLSDVGGAIGLWIGLSILSLCELVQLFVELCDYGIHKTVKERRQKKKKRRKERKTPGNGNDQSFENKNESLWPNMNFGYGHKSGRSDMRSFTPSRSGHDRYSADSQPGGDTMYDRPYKDDFNNQSLRW